MTEPDFAQDLMHRAVQAACAHIVRDVASYDTHTLMQVFDSSHEWTRAYRYDSGNYHQPTWLAALDVQLAILRRLAPK